MVFTAMADGNECVPAYSTDGKCPVRRGIRNVAVAVLVAAVAAAAGGTGSAPRASAAEDGDWTTYHHDNARSGVAAGLAALGTLSRAWSATLDGAVYGQPLAVADRVFAATENDTVYALDAATGAVAWSTHVGTPVRRSSLPCGNIDPLGITSTMVYDPATNLLFALAERTGPEHVLVSIDATTGQVSAERAAEPPRGDPAAHQQRAALNLLGDRVYIAYGGLAGDCANYIGSVVSLPTTGTGPATSYAVPTTREAGIWAPGGATVVDGNLLYAVGNGESTSGEYDGSDSVVALSPDLQLADRFAPSSWAADNAADLDLGSMTPALVGSYVYADGKRGTGYTLRSGALGGIGGQVAQATVCRAYGGAAVDGDTVYVPCADGPRAVQIGSAGEIQVLWRGPATAKGSPVVGGGAVWVVDYDGGTLFALDPATGSVRQQISVGVCPHFASPTLAHDRAYVGTTSGVVAIAGA
jgi:polyvinyl alcohol dehydrogenase (cytochrome)